MAKILVVLSISAVGIAALMLFSRLESSHQQAYEYGDAVDGFRMGISLRSDALDYVESGGAGETIQLGVHMTTSSPNWERLDNDELAFSVKPSAFRVHIDHPDGNTETFVPTQVQFGSFRGDGGGSEWSYSISFPLKKMHLVDGENNFDVRAILNKELLNKLLGNTASDQAMLGSTSKTITLKPLSLREASFSQRMHSLMSGLPATEVRRILGDPKEITAVDDSIKQHWPNYRMSWEYSNPDYSDDVPEKRRKVILHFDSQSELIEYWQAIYGC